MASIVDDRGYNQGFKETEALRVRTERRVDAMVRELDLTRKGGRILELGCGTGLLSKMLSDRAPGFDVTGVDLCQPFIDEANQKYGGEHLRYARLDLNGDIQHLGQFDYIVGNGILHHLINQLDSALTHIQSMLKPGGKIVFWEPNLWNPYVYAIFSFGPLRKLAKLEPDEMAFTQRFITRTLGRAGYGNVRVSCRDFLLPNVPDGLIQPVIRVGDWLEKTDVTARFAQSLFIAAEKAAEKPSAENSTNARV